MKSLSLITVSMLVARVMGHGYLMDPPARNSMWRSDFKSKPNYDDNGLNCGGYSNQWETHGGKCGICGDPYQGPRKHEAGGVFAAVDRPVTRCFNTKQNVMDIHVVLTAHHKGYFEFRLCEHNSINTRAQQSCFDNGILLTVHGTGTSRYDISEMKQRDYYFQLDMPNGITCTQCILQWKYNAGNNWDCDESGCDNGLGKQEQFINCADIAIMDNCSSNPTTSPVSTAEPTTKTDSETTTDVPKSTTVRPTKVKCKGVGDWNSKFLMQFWCKTKCMKNPDSCPRNMCKCKFD